MLAYFAILGLVEGLWVARIPEVKAHLRLTDGLLGAALLAGPAGLVLVMPVAGWLTDRLGGARLSRPAAAAVTLLPITLWRAGTVAAVIAALLTFGIAGGVLDVGINALGVRMEHACGRPLMASFHACYSLAGLAGAVLGGLLAGRRASPFGPLAGLALAGVAVTVLAGRHLADGPAAPRPGPEPAGGAGQAPGRAAARPLELGLLALCGVICEGAAGNWSGVYLRGYAGAPVWLAAAGFAAFSAAMAAGRLAGDRLAARYGPAGLVRRSGLVAAGGLAGALCSHQLAAAVLGFAACGAGLSCTVPQLLSVAGRADPAHPGAGIARVAGLGFVGLVGGPALIGGCASLVGLPLALGIPVLLGLGMAAFAGRLEPREAAPGGPPAARRPPGRPAPRAAGHPAARPARRPAVRSAAGHPYGGAMDDKEILGHIDELIRTEHDLREKLAQGALSGDEEQAQLRSVEQSLDQCWDLLRQRRARREFGEDPGDTTSRPVAEVEGYLQ